MQLLGSRAITQFVASPVGCVTIQLRSLVEKERIEL